MTNTLAAFHITVTQNLLFTTAGIACIVFALLSAYYIFEWHRYGVKEREVFVAESMYVIVSVTLLGLMLLAASFF